MVGIIEGQLGLTPTGRPGKSIPSIIEKLKRESIRLSQIQDIAGCRIVVADVPEQDAVARRIAEVFENATIIDRRTRPSHGYRAVHIVVRIDGFAVEVQIRTLLQHLWAEYSEILSDLVDKGLKYGGGPEDFRENLVNVSQLVANLEAIPAGMGSPEREALRLKVIELFGRFVPELERFRR